MNSSECIVTAFDMICVFLFTLVCFLMCLCVCARLHYLTCLMHFMHVFMMYSGFKHHTIIHSLLIEKYTVLQNVRLLYIYLP